uniref:Uncharacterized protein n=1 Tax=Salix viminalis TaxID=40686 RepID=A0A6N2LKW4_SALVM
MLGRLFLVLDTRLMRNYFRWSCHVTLFNLKRTCLYNCYNGCQSKEIVSPKFTVPNQSCCTKMATVLVPGNIASETLQLC